MYPRSPRLPAQRDVKIKKGTEGVKVWVVSFPEDCLGQERKRGVWGTLGQIWGWSTHTGPCHTPGSVAQRCYLATSHCANVSLWVVWSGGAGENKRTGWLEPDDLLPHHLLEGGLVLTGCRKTKVVPYPSGGLAFLPRLVESFTFLPVLFLWWAVNDSIFTSGEVFTDHRTHMSLKTLQAAQWLVIIALRFSKWKLKRSVWYVTI